jgi:GNAT superfamily N-acetyltransferase
MAIPQLVFRQSEFDDIYSIISLVNSAYRGESGKQGWTTEADLLDGQRTDQDEINRLLTAQDSLILLAEIEGELVASVHLEKHQEGAYFGMLAVRPHWQNQGIGKTVIATAESIAKQQWKADKMLMTVITLRHELIDFYGRCGYLRTGRTIPFPTSEKFGIQKVPGLILEYLEKPLAN